MQNQRIPDRAPTSYKAAARVIRPCQICGQDFLVPPKYADAYSTCSADCSAERRRREKTGRDGIAPEERNRACLECGLTFRIASRSKPNLYCSNECRLIALNRQDRRRSEGTFSRTVGPTGYARVFVWDGDVKRQVMEHRYVMEQSLGRRLSRTERVHHINGVRDDNRIENLALCADQAEHLRTWHPDHVHNLPGR